jgi:CxxC-x17-CxxC domain-containing protein
MKNFNDRGGNRGGFKPRGGGFRGQVTMHQATCAKCGQSCEVPFRPSGDKPVFCSNCFKRPEGGNDRAPKRDFNRPSFTPSFERSRENKESRGSNTGGDNIEIKRQLEAVNNKLDQLIVLLSRPTESEPVIIKKVGKVAKKKIVTK